VQEKSVILVDSGGNFRHVLPHHRTLLRLRATVPPAPQEQRPVITITQGAHPMTSTPRDVLSAAFVPKSKPTPPPRFVEEDELLVEIRDLICKAENKPRIRDGLRALLSDSLLQMKQEDAARSGLIGVMYPELA
jgi:hypothetical protein